MYEVRIKRKGGERVPGLSSEVEEILWTITGKDLGKA
jgi:hypothetical protein